MSALRRYRLPRASRLKRQRLIRPLFASDRGDVGSVRVGPVVVRFRTVPVTDLGAPVSVQVGFAVSRGIGSKPHRNRLRRILREVYRVHQYDLVDLFAARPDALTLMVLYRGRREGAEVVIRRTLPQAIARVASAIPPPLPRGVAAR